MPLSNGYAVVVGRPSRPSAYYVVKKPEKSVTMLTPEAQLSPAYTAFFEQFRGDMRTNLKLRLLLTPKVWRWARVALTGYSRSRMLGELSSIIVVPSSGQPAIP